MSGVHITGPANIEGDVVAGDKIIVAATRMPRTLLEKAEELVVDAELEFGKAVVLLKGLRNLRKARKSGDQEAIREAASQLKAMEGAQIIVTIIETIESEE